MQLPGVLFFYVTERLNFIKKTLKHRFSGDVLEEVHRYNNFSHQRGSDV